MCGMARLNVYVPDELAERAKATDVNISALAQAAIADELRPRATNSWLDALPAPIPSPSWLPVFGRAVPTFA